MVTTACPYSLTEHRKATDQAWQKAGAAQSSLCHASKSSRVLGFVSRKCQVLPDIGGNSEPPQVLKSHRLTVLHLLLRTRTAKCQCWPGEQASPDGSSVRSLQQNHATGCPHSPHREKSVTKSALLILTDSRLRAGPL